MRRVSITWHNNTNKKHIITIIKNHNKTHPLLWPWKNQLRIHPSKESRKLREPVWRPKRPQNASKNSAISLENTTIGLCAIVASSVSFCRFRKVLVRPNRTSYAKVTAKTVQHPRNPNRSSGRSLFLASPLIKQLHTNCTDEPSYSITSDHNLEQLQIELQD